MKIALIAHDKKKEEIIELAKKYDLRNQFEQAARRYSSEEERSTRI